MRGIAYNRPNLIHLPSFYSDLFSYYVQKKCKFCSKFLTTAHVCLICGEHFCYNHCDSMESFIIDHQTKCGLSLMPLLNINSSFIYIIRGDMVAKWASLYLDEHGEEDFNLL